MTPRPLRGTGASSVAHEEDRRVCFPGQEAGRDHRLPSVPSAAEGNPTPQPPLTQALPPGSPLRGIALLAAVRMPALLVNVP